MSFPWLRTLDDAKAEAALRMLGSVLQCVKSGISVADVTNRLNTSFLVELQPYIGWSCEASVNFHRGRLCIEGRGNFGRDYGLFSVSDTESICTTNYNFINQDALIVKIEHWIAGLRSPLVTQLPVNFEQAVAEIEEMATVAATLDEPSWASLIIDPQHGPSAPVMTVILNSGLEEFYLDTTHPRNKLHNELAKRIVSIRDAYTHVREAGGFDVRIDIGAPGSMSAEPQSTVDLSSAMKRYPNGFGLYSQY